MVDNSTEFALDHYLYGTLHKRMGENGTKTNGYLAPVIMISGHYYRNALPQ